MRHQFAKKCSTAQLVVVVYTPPAHTSDKTQLCDLVAFGQYEFALSKSIKRVLKVNSTAFLDMYDYSKLMTHAFYSSFTLANISSSF